MGLLSYTSPRTEMSVETTVHLAKKTGRRFKHRPALNS
jgi:hypothetical protein